MPCGGLSHSLAGACQLGLRLSRTQGQRINSSTLQSTLKLRGREGAQTGRACICMPWAGQVCSERYAPRAGRRGAEVFRARGRRAPPVAPRRPRPSSRGDAALAARPPATGIPGLCTGRASPGSPGNPSPEREGSRRGAGGEPEGSRRAGERAAAAEVTFAPPPPRPPPRGPAVPPAHTSRARVQSGVNVFRTETALSSPFPPAPQGIRRQGL